MHTLLQDVRFAVRVLARSPGFTAVAVLVLALGTGATTTIFSFTNAALLSPLPGIAHPDRVVTIGHTRKGQGFDNSSYPTFRQLRDSNTVFSDVTAEHPLPVSVAAGGRADRVNGALVTPNYFRTLGVGLARGRAFADGEDVGGGAPPVVVISYGLWSRRFGRAAGVVGSPISIDGVPMTVVGIAERGFIGTSRASAADVWVPMSAARQVLPSWIDLDETLRHPDWVWIMLYARLKPGVDLDQANAQVQAIAERLRATNPELAAESAGWHIARGAGADPDEEADLARMTAILFGVVALLLVLACANVSSLLLARAAARAREMTVRSALGAPRGRLIRQLLTESVLLAGLGGTAGLALSYVATAALADFFAGSARFSLALDIAPDSRVLAFTLVVSALTGIAFGVAPAFHASRISLVSGLKAAAALAPRRSRLRPLLVVTQLALSLVLLVGAGLLLRTMWNFSRIGTGFDGRGLLLLTIEPTLTHKYGSGELHTFYDRLLARVQALPGIEAATLARVAPVSARGWGVNARFPDKPNDPNRGLQYNTVMPNYFALMGIPIVRGRGFTTRDSAASPRVMIINETMAGRVWPGEDPIGKQVLVADETVPREVVGVVPDLKYRSLLEKPRPFVYFSMSQPYPLWDAPTVVHVRTRLSTGEAAAAVGREVQALDPDLPIFDVKTIADQVADSYWRQRVTGMLVAIFAVLALALGSAGVYGVMSYIAAERTREVGIRLALGARTADVTRMIVAQGAMMVGAGAVIGTAASLAATRLLTALLYGVTERDPAVVGLSIGVLAATALVATYIPARRAARRDPLAALRCE